MASNLSEFGNVVSSTNNNIIGSIPSYLRKQKETFNKDIAAWEYNSKSSNVDAIIMAIGTGSVLSDNVSYKLSVFSSFVLGRGGYNNRWQLNYESNDNLLITYFDGDSYFKRLTIDYSTGLNKVRNVDMRNGNSPNCNAYHQIGFGYSPEASFEDYSNYRHNIRSSHSGDANFNGENALDLYIWDATNDTPSELGSRHVLRWNAQGNEELISGFRIDGGVSFDINSSDRKELEKTNFAVPGKGVLYYNKSSNTYRYSTNGGLFNDLGGASTSSSCLIRPCTSSLTQVDFSNSTASFCSLFTEPTLSYFFTENTLTSNIDVALDILIATTGIKNSSIILPEPSEKLLGTEIYLSVRRNTEYDVRMTITSPLGGTGDNVTYSYIENGLVPGDRVLLIRNDDSSKSGIYILESKTVGGTVLNLIFSQSETNKLALNQMIVSYSISGDTLIPTWNSLNAQSQTILVQSLAPAFTYSVGYGTIPNYINDSMLKFQIATNNSINTLNLTAKTVLTTNDPLYGTYVVGGVMVSVSDKVLVNKSSNKEQNGLYVVTAGAWVRDTNLNTAAQFYRNNRILIDGTQSAFYNKYYKNNLSNSIVLGTSEITFIEYDGDVSYYKDFIRDSSNRDDTYLDYLKYSGVDNSLEYFNYTKVKLHLKCVRTTYEKKHAIGNYLYEIPVNSTKKYAWQVFSEKVNR